MLDWNLFFATLIDMLKWPGIALLISGSIIGMIFGAFSLARTFFLPYFGRLSDLKGRKPLIIPGLLAYALISLGFVFVKDVNVLIILRFFQGIASAML